MKKLAAAFTFLTWTFALMPIDAHSAFAQSVQVARRPAQADWTAIDFNFHTGEKMPALRLHYATLGNPKSPAVLVLHGTGGTGASMLSGEFGSELFGPGQPLDANKYFIILPDAIGSGQSAKPSDGLRMKFPQYNYDDIVAAQYRLLTEGLGLKHLYVVTGVSMGGMLTWTWAEAHPDFMDALVPLASTPTAMSGRNWMLRRMIIETIKRDPAWQNGDYTSQPPSLSIANTFFGIATSGGTLAIQKNAPTREAADRIVDARLAAQRNGDANDTIYQWNASRDFDPSPGLERIAAPLLAVNSADDERNPPETGIMQRQIARVKNGHFYLIPASENTSGHGTVNMARLWKSQLITFLASVPVSSTQ
jgi:homoserine O-acetyltransferase/O-succinyltransferase